ncbi:SDR family NAD(P)-dependent oxidoreductase [Nonomuraea phyllanthi]|nr:SDR family NAD(P)-dependent oxidoreductase [Nonomuraea phyllanthi]
MTDAPHRAGGVPLSIMKTELRGRTVLITGGTSGIGRALAEELDRRGNTVIVCGRRTDRLAELRERHPGIAVHQCDLALDDHRQRLADQLAKEFPSLDMVVNNAGIQLRSDVSRPIDPARLRAETDVNLIAPTHLTSLLAGQLAGKPGATVVNVTSALAFAPLVTVAYYSATKAAVHSLTISMREQLKELGIRVVEVAPPAVDTELGGDLRDDPTATHGGMRVAEFVAATVAGLEAGADEILVGLSQQLKADPEGMFDTLNSMFDRG